MLGPSDFRHWCEVAGIRKAKKQARDAKMFLSISKVSPREA